MLEEIKVFRNYFYTAFRYMKRSKLFSLINIAGLSIGMTAVLLILMYVANELSYENFHHFKNRIYRVETSFGQGQSKMRFAGTMEALAPAVAADIPEVEKAVRFKRDSRAKISVEENQFIESNVFFSDAEVFEVFSFYLLNGDAASALQEPNSVVITDEMAMKYFGDESSVGRTIFYDENPLKVTGIMQKVQPNTHLAPDFLISFSTLKALGMESQAPWQSAGSIMTYLLVKSEVKKADLLPQVQDVLTRNTNEYISNIFTFDLIRLTDIHFHKACIVDIGPKGDKVYVYIFTSVAALILLIACFNFVLLTTARSLNRFKEVGVRKVVGARRKHLTVQFIVESLITAAIALVFSLFLFELLFPKLNYFLGNSLIPGAHNLNHMFYFVPALLILVGIFAGFYPAMVISRFQVADAVKAKSFTGTGMSGIKRGIIMTQFCISMVLLVATLAVYKQMHFMKNADLGFNKSDVLLIDNPMRNSISEDAFQQFKALCLQHPAVTSVSGVYTVPGVRSKETQTIRKEGADSEDRYTIQGLSVDEGFIPTLGLSISEGRNFSSEIPTDKQGSVILNRKAVEYLSLTDPIDVILNIPRNEEMVPVRVIGVIDDFFITSMQEEIGPLMLYVNPHYYYMIALRIQPGTADDVTAHLQKIWTDVVPDRPFEYEYLEDVYNGLYRAEEKMGQLMMIFSGLAIFIASLGLLGLVHFMTARRFKEIGIRKVLGASVPSILKTLLMDYLRWVVVACLLASPIAFFIVRYWLTQYAYKITINAGLFLSASAFVIFVSVFTTILQARRAATANPVESLRYE